MKDKLPFACRAVEWLANDWFIEMPEEDRQRLSEGRALLKNHSALIPINHLALPDPVLAAALLVRAWRGAVKNLQAPASQKFYDGRMGQAGYFALNLARQSGIGMPAIIQRGDENYSEEEKKRVNEETTRILKQALQTPGGVVPYAPEATRSRTGSMIPATGLLQDILALNHGFNYTDMVFVQPIAMWGTEKLWGIDKLPNPFATVHVRASAPLTLTELLMEATHYDLTPLNEAAMPDGRKRGKRPIGDMIMVHLACMVPLEYRGAYADYVRE